jgi:hypothetical protein
VGASGVARTSAALAELKGPSVRYCHSPPAQPPDGHGGDRAVRRQAAEEDVDVLDVVALQGRRGADQVVAVLSDPAPREGRRAPPLRVRRRPRTPGRDGADSSGRTRAPGTAGGFRAGQGPATSLVDRRPVSSIPPSVRLPSPPDRVGIRVSAGAGGRRRASGSYHIPDLDAEARPGPGAGPASDRPRPIGSADHSGAGTARFADGDEDGRDHLRPGRAEHGRAPILPVMRDGWTRGAQPGRLLPSLKQEDSHSAG